MEGIASEVGLEVWVARQWLGRAGQAGPARPEGVNKRVLKLGTKDGMPAVPLPGFVILDKSFLRTSVSFYSVTGAN